MSLSTGIRCGNCKTAHPTVADVKACFARKHTDTARVSDLAARGAAAVESARLREIRAFGHSRLGRMTVSAQAAAKASVQPAKPATVDCYAGPAGIACYGDNGGQAGLGWDGQKFTRFVPCPRCDGSGQMTPADVKRCEYHDDRYMAERIMADFA